MGEILACQNLSRNDNINETLRKNQDHFIRKHRLPFIRYMAFLGNACRMDHISHGMLESVFIQNWNESCWVKCMISRFI